MRLSPEGRPPLKGSRFEPCNCKFQRCVMAMVARDGIEPPTPAFSGPRSTTELPGQLLHRRALEVLFTLPVGMPLHLPLSFRGRNETLSGRSRERDNCVSIAFRNPGFRQSQRLPAQRHLLANIAVACGKMNRKLALWSDRSPLYIQPPAVALAQKQRLRAAALGFQQQRK